MKDAGYRIGIDVGGTNTDGVILDPLQRFVRKAKSPTTPDVATGIRVTLERLLDGWSGDRRAVRYCMLGTTHCINAILERRGLDRVAVLRLGTPSTDAVPPFSDWPASLRDVVKFRSFSVAGGHEFHGRVIRPLDVGRLHRIAASLAGRVRAIAVTSVFSPVNSEHERAAARVLRHDLGAGVSVSLSHEIATIGLLERENATILNAALRSVSERAILGFRRAARALGLRARLLLGQNDGTLMDAAAALRYPILTVSSGPTNSIRGASFLGGVADSIVVDVGGTSTDIGLLKGGFPLQSARPSLIGGVRTNFRIPDVLSLALGGGSRVRTDGGLTVGPDSVGYRLPQEARAAGGPTLTTTDVAVALGRCDFGDRRRLRDLPRPLARAVDRRVREMLEEGIETVRISSQELPVVLVGGGSVLVGAGRLASLPVVRPEHFDVANAIGVAIAEVGAEVDTIVSYEGAGRAATLDRLRAAAIARAVAAGARRAGTRVAQLEEIPLSYLPGNSVRVRVKACGALAA